MKYYYDMANNIASYSTMITNNCTSNSNSTWESRALITYVSLIGISSAKFGEQLCPYLVGKYQTNPKCLNKVKNDSCAKELIRIAI